MGNILFDTHAHYGDSRFESEFPGGAAAALESAFATDTGYILNASVDLEDSRRSLELASRYPNVYASAGIHPEDCEKYAGDSIDAVMSELEELLGEAKAVALGEIGLDYHWNVPRELQWRWFEAQLTLARELDAPVIIHDREAHGDILKLLSAHKGLRGIMHSFSGSAEMARELAGKGWYISFSGTVTFKNARKVAEAAAAVPPERLLIETDCPYLAPHPHRGKINYSGYLAYTAAALAEIKGMDYDSLCAQTTGNAKLVYGIQ